MTHWRKRIISRIFSILLLVGSSNSVPSKSKKAISYSDKSTFSEIKFFSTEKMRMMITEMMHAIIRPIVTEQRTLARMPVEPLSLTISL